MKKTFIFVFICIMIFSMVTKVSYAFIEDIDGNQNPKSMNCEVGPCFEDGGGGGSDNLTPEQKVNQAINSIDFNSIIQHDNNLHFPSFGLHSVQIHWTSSHPNIISNTGNLNRINNDYVTVSVTAVFCFSNYSNSKTYYFYVFPQADNSSEQHDLATSWLNHQNYNQFMGTLQSGNSRYDIFLDGDILESSRLYTRQYFSFTTAPTIEVTESYTRTYGTTTEFSTSVKTELTTSVNAFIANSSIAISAQTGASLSLTNEWSYTHQTTQNFVNTRTHINQNGTTVVMPARVMYYEIFIPVRVETYFSFSVPFQTSKFESLINISYVTVPVRNGFYLEWSDQLMENWTNGEIVDSTTFYGPFTPIYSEIESLF